MHNYHTDLVLIIDKVLLFFSLLLALVIVLYAIAKERYWGRRRRILLKIKKDVYEAVLAGKKDIKSASLATPGEFLDVLTNRNREIVFFNEAEQKLFRDSFLAAQKIGKLEHVVLKSRNKWRRIEAILCLGYAQDPLALKSLHKAVFDKDEDVVYFSMLALGQIRTIESARILLAALKKNEFARFKIASILEGFPAEVAEQVGNLLEDKIPAVRLWAIKILSKFKSGRFIKEIEELTRDKSEEVRSAACECFGELGKKEAKDALSRCLKDDAWVVRVSAVKALVQIFGKDCFAEVVPLINDGSLSVIDALKDIMAAHIEAALPYIEDFLYGEDGIAKRTAVEALEASGYVTKIFEHILRGGDKEKNLALKLLGGLLKSKARFGIEASLMDFDEEERKNLSGVINSLKHE